MTYRRERQRTSRIGVLRSTSLCSIDRRESRLLKGEKQEGTDRPAESVNRFSRSAILTVLPLGRRHPFHPLARPPRCIGGCPISYKLRLSACRACRGLPAAPAEESPRQTCISHDSIQAVPDTVARAYGVRWIETLPRTLVATLVVLGSHKSISKISNVCSPRLLNIYVNLILF